MAGGILVKSVDLNVLNMRTRMPFRYGIAELRALPHLMVRVTCEIDEGKAVGLAADGLPPKWFTKNPSSDVAADLLEMIHVIRHAAEEAPRIEANPSLFEFWRQLYDRQAAWGAAEKLPPLLTNFGVSLIERAMIDAFCRDGRVTLSTALRENLFRVKLGEIYPELAGGSPVEFLPKVPLRQIILRHTVGLGDPLTDADIPAAELLDDGLPQSLEANIRAYGLTHFKIKLSGNLAKDQPRLRDLNRVLKANDIDNFAFTLDGNEQFHDLAEFRSIWDALVADSTLKDFFSKMIFVEQPLHRDVALSEATGRAMLAWKSRPPTIIDESDGDLQSLRQALACGYVGTSHKNCKGVFKGLANACFIEHLRRTNPGKRYEMSGEDLANVGPVAMLQDVCAAANFGLTHVERNGHHYFAGLSMWPKDIQKQTLIDHADLYHERHEFTGASKGPKAFAKNSDQHVKALVDDANAIAEYLKDPDHARGFATLKIVRGKIDVGSTIDAPFGVSPLIDSRQFTPLNEWSVKSL